MAKHKHPAEDFYRATRAARASQSANMPKMIYMPSSPPEQCPPTAGLNEMDKPQGPTVKERLAAFDELEKRQLKLCQAMYQADGGKLYPVDLLAAAALNRSIALSAGFRMLIAARNMICAGAILRLQLDTALRFFAAFLVEKPHEFAMSVLNGTKVSMLRDRSGHLMKDGYLVSQLSRQHPWLKRVYHETSGYVHLSNKHIMSIFEQVNEGDRTVRMKVSAMDKPMPEELYVEAIEAFRAATGALIEYVQGWIATKDNSEIVSALRREFGKEP